MLPEKKEKIHKTIKALKSKKALTIMLINYCDFVT